MTNIQPIKKSSVSDAVFSDMLEKIIGETWKEGELIPSEYELSSMYGVSRDSIRQAINRLRAIGVLRSQQGKGTYVETVNAGVSMNLLAPMFFLGKNDSVEVLEFLKAIQIESVRIDCNEATDAQIAELEEYLYQMMLAEDYSTFFDRDMDYHEYVAKMTGNALFIKVTHIMRDLLQVYLRDVVTAHGSSRSMEHHKEIYEALKKRDVSEARSIMTEHYDMLLERVRNWILLTKEEQQELIEKNKYKLNV